MMLFLAVAGMLASWCVLIVLGSAWLWTLAGRLMIASLPWSSVTPVMPLYRRLFAYWVSLSRGVVWAYVWFSPFIALYLMARFDLDMATVLCMNASLPFQAFMGFTALVAWPCLAIVAYVVIGVGGQFAAEKMRQACMGKGLEQEQ